MGKDNLKSLKRVVSSLSEEEANEVMRKYELGEPTGYATIDRPWNSFYENVEQNDAFIGTTP